MLKRLGYYVFIGTLCAAAILLAIILIPGCNNSFSILLEQIFRTNGNQISTAAPLLIPFVVFVLVSLIGLACCFIIKPKPRDEQQETEKKKADIFYPFFFFAFALSSLLIVPLTAWIVFNPFTGTYEISHNPLIPAIFIGCLGLALLQAALLMSAVFMWKVNKLASFLLFFIVAVSIPSCVLAGSAIHHVADTDPSEYYVDEAIYDDGEAVSEPEEVEYSPNLFEELWVVSEADSDSVQLAIELFSKQLGELDNDSDGILGRWSYGHGIRENIYDADLWSDKSDYEQALSNFLKIADYVSEHKDYLYTAFSDYVDLLFNAVPSETYYKSGFSELIVALNDAHRDLYDNNNNRIKARLSGIYRVMTTVNHSSASDYYDDIKPYTTTGGLANFTDDEGEVKKPLVVWAYSFWGRRYHEDTQDNAYAILMEVMSHYEDYD